MSGFQPTWSLSFIVQLSIFANLFLLFENRHFRVRCGVNAPMEIKARVLFPWCNPLDKVQCESCKSYSFQNYKIKIVFVFRNCLVKWYNDLPGSVSPSIIPMTFWIFRISLGVSTTRWIRLESNDTEFKLWKGSLVHLGSVFKWYRNQSTDMLGNQSLVSIWWENCP